MAVNIHKLIATINPGLFCDNIKDNNFQSPADKVKANLKSELDNLRDNFERMGKKPKINDIAKVYLKVSDDAKLISGDFMNLEEIGYTNAFSLVGVKNPIEKHKLVYDSFGEGLEPVYFWLLDSMNDRYKKVDKLVDNFSSTVSSSFFAEMGQRATKMQDEAMKLLGTVNTVIKSVLNILYDLKEFKIRLETYNEFHAKDAPRRNAALLSLKQIWLDQVDIKRGNTAIKAMAQQFDYVTLIDAFMATDSLKQLNIKDGEEGYIDLNERVRRLLLQRYGEFDRWLGESEKELRKRFDIEKNYLKSQMATIHLYARWIKPYLKSARELEQTNLRSSSLVSAFNTLILELTILGQNDYDPKPDVLNGDLPVGFDKINMRKYHPIMVVEFKFRSSPERMQQGGYAYRGRVEVEFTSYALNDDETKLLNAAIEEDDIGDTLRLISDATEDSITQIEQDIAEFLSDKKEEEKTEEEKTNSKDVNPFSALFSFSGFGKKKKSETDFSQMISKDDYHEKVVRSLALIDARRGCRKMYDVYKKSHGMPAFPGS